MNLDIWAFVRVMVQLEEGGSSGPLFDAWAEPWGEVDAQLADLAQSDFEGYSEMMMATQIELELEADHRTEFEAAVRAVIKSLKAKRNSADEEMREDLKFEIDGLYAILAG